MKKTNLPRIIGAGGDSGSQTAPFETDDTLNSIASAQILDLLCEGEIEGLVDGLKSIFLDGTPIENADGTFNFKNVIVESRVGTQEQTYMTGAPETENEIAVGVEIFAATPAVRTITNPNVDVVRVLLSFPQMSLQDSGGDLTGNQVQYAVDLQSNGAGFVEVVNQLITGKSMSKYERSFRVPLSGGVPYDIRVRRITPDSTTVESQNRTIWESYAEVEEIKLSYPNSALIGIRCQADQFQQIPSRGYDVKLMKIKIPSNYDPLTRVYTGSWDGTFSVAWSDNPAWIFYDLITNSRYGLGLFIDDSQVDKWGLYSIAKYCDELVEDGYGALEPRFTCNLYIQARAEAYQVINDLASIFRGMVYWAGGAITVSQDSPQDASYLFTPANVINGAFNYQGADVKGRHTVALVTWNDPTDSFSQKVEYVEDQDGIARFGVVETQLTAMGCTSRGQAHRLGRWALYTERFQSETVLFQTGLDGAQLMPGQIIKISDPVRAGKRAGGRVSAATDSTLTVDGDLAFSTDTPLNLSVLLLDGTVETVSVLSLEGRVITINGTFSSNPQPQSIWMLTNAEVDAQQFRVITITESAPGVFDVTALAHSPDKFTAIDTGIILEPRSISDLTVTPSSPTDILITETLYAVGKDVRNKITVSWRIVSEASSYQVTYQKGNGNPVTISSNSNDVEILSAEPGAYTFYIYSLTGLGKRSVAAVATKTISGKGLLPANVSNFSLIPQANMAYLTWDQSSDLDVTIGGSVRIRYSPDTSTPVWKESVDIIDALPGTATHAQAPLLSGTYMAKFVDSSGNSSLAEAIIITTIPEALALNVVQTITEDPSFAGTSTNMVYRDDFGGLVLAATTLVDDIADVDSIPSWDFLGGVSSEGEYIFDGSTDLGAVYTSRITASIAVEGIDVTDTIDQRIDLCDDWQDIDGDFIDDVNVAIYLRTTEDDPSSSPTWTDWKPFFVGDYKARGIQFKAVATSLASSHSVIITALSVTVDMPDRSIDIEGIVSGTSAYSVSFEEPFHATPSIGITAHNMVSGDFYVIASKTKSGFDITFKSASGTIVSRTFDVIAKGYGRAS